MNAEYDDWYSENAPCSSESSDRSPSPSSRGSTDASTETPWPLMRIQIAIVFLALVLGFVTGCAANRTVFVPEDSPMRTGPDSRIKVYHRVNGEWILSGNRITVPEGWYLVPPSFVKE
jgi:hypothetical protein